MLCISINVDQESKPITEKYDRIKLECVALKQGVRYESERQWEGFWQINKSTNMSLKNNEKYFDKDLRKKALSLHIEVAFHT